MFLIVPSPKDIEDEKSTLDDKYYTMVDTKKLFKAEEVRQIIFDYTVLLSGALWAWKFDSEKVKELTEVINKGII